MFGFILTSQILHSQPLPRDCTTYVLTPGGAADPLTLLPLNGKVITLGNTTPLQVNRGHNGTFTATNGLVFSNLTTFHYVNGKVSQITIPGTSLAYNPYVSTPEGLLFYNSQPQSHPEFYLISNNQKVSARFYGPAMAGATIQFAYTVSALNPCLSIKSQSGAQSYLYETGAWNATPTKESSFYASAVCASGTVVGGTAEKIGKQSSKQPLLHPAYWKEGKLHALPLPKQLEPKSNASSVSLVLIMEWKGNFLAQSNPAKAGSSPDFWVYSNRTWINLNNQYQTEFPKATVVDYDLTNGRILLANQSHYKIIQL